MLWVRYPQCRSTLGNASLLALPLSRMIRLIHLKRPFNALDQSEEDSKNKHDHRYPDRIPPHTIPPVEPPLCQPRWSRIVKSLFENHEPIMPEIGLLELTIVNSQRAAFRQHFVQRLRISQLSKPVLGFGIVLREQEGYRADGLFDESEWKHLADVVSDEFQSEQNTVVYLFCRFRNDAWWKIATILSSSSTSRRWSAKLSVHWILMPAILCSLHVLKARSSFTLPLSSSASE